MKRPFLLSAILLALFNLITVQGLAAQVASAQAGPPGQMLVVVADGAALKEYEGGADLVRSFVGLLATLQEEQSVVFMNVEDPSTVVGPIMASVPELEGALDDIQAGLRSPGPRPAGSLIAALGQVHTLLSDEKAAAGSSVYVITGDSPVSDASVLSQRVYPLLDRFASDGWTINGASLPSAPAGTLRVLEALASKTGGGVFDLSNPEGFERLVDAMLRHSAKGSLSPIAQSRLSPSDLMTAVVSVTPGTRQTTIVLFRETPQGSFRLSNPSGFEASAGDRAVSQVVELPHVVVWRLVDPAPGNWTIDIRGLDGVISAWENSTNKYSLVLPSPVLAPLGQPTVLMAMVAQDGKPVILDGVSLHASVTTPDGTTLVHEMKDDGLGSDSVAGDGYFTATIAPLRSEGSYDVDLELSWLKYNYRISSRATFEAMAFPALEVRTDKLVDLKPGERTKVATVYVHVKGEPYLVDADQLTATLASNQGKSGSLEVVPKQLFGSGPAWEYEVYFTAREEGRHTVIFRLDLEYAGSEFSYTTDSFVLSAVAPPAVTVPVVEPPPTAAVARSAVETVPAPVPVSRPALPSVESSGFPWGWLAATLLLLAGVGGAVAYLTVKPGPHGYLYNDKEEQLIDFERIRRHPVLRFLLKGTVPGKELKVPGLEGVVFHFSRKRIFLHGLRGHSTVRVNNQPLVGQATIQDRTWIGTRGRLYTFLLSPLGAEAGASAD